jgi:hypothetical protein
LPENWWSKIGELGKLGKSPLISSSKIERWPLVLKKWIKRECCEHWLPDKPGKILKMKKENKSPRSQQKPSCANFAFCCLRYFCEMG